MEGEALNLLILERIKGNIVKRDSGAYKSDGRKIVNFVGVEVTCWDK